MNLKLFIIVIVDGGLINVDVNSEDFKEARFQFNVKDDHNKNQKRYEKIGEVG